MSKRSSPSVGGWKSLTWQTEALNQALMSTRSQVAVFILFFIFLKKQQLVKENMCYACEEQNLGISHLKSLAQHIDVNKEGFQEIPSMGHFLTLFFMRNGSGFPTISNP